jgi:hypothetical protein
MCSKRGEMMNVAWERKENWWTKGMKRDRKGYKGKTESFPLTHRCWACWVDGDEMYQGITKREMFEPHSSSPTSASSSSPPSNSHQRRDQHHWHHFISNSPWLNQCFKIKHVFNTPSTFPDSFTQMVLTLSSLDLAGLLRCRELKLARTLRRNLRLRYLRSWAHMYCPYIFFSPSSQ